MPGQNKLMPGCARVWLRLCIRVNHDTDNVQRRLLIIQLPVILNERLRVEDEENSIEQVDSSSSCFM